MTQQYIHVWLGDSGPDTEVHVIMHAGTKPAQPPAEPGDAVAAMVQRLEKYARSGLVRPAYDALEARHLTPVVPMTRKGKGNPELRWTDGQGGRTRCWLHSGSIQFWDGSREKVRGMPGADDRGYAVVFSIMTEKELKQALAAVDAAASTAGR
jgi:hypothetical protein